MCGPLAIGALSFAVSAMGQIAEFQAKDAEAKAAHQAATSAYQQDVQTIALRQMQEQDATAQKLQLQNIDEAQRKSAVELAASEAGVAGISVDNLVADVTRNAARNRVAERRNLQMTVTQLQLDKKGSQSGNQGRINQTPRPSPLGLVAGIAGAGLKAFAQGREAMA